MDRKRLSRNSIRFLGCFEKRPIGEAGIASRELNPLFGIRLG